MERTEFIILGRQDEGNIEASRDLVLNFLQYHLLIYLFGILSTM